MYSILGEMFMYSCLVREKHNEGFLEHKINKIGVSCIYLNVCVYIMIKNYKISFSNLDS